MQIGDVIGGATVSRVWVQRNGRTGAILTMPGGAVILGLPPGFTDDDARAAVARALQNATPAR
jgi:hypothetical protein